MFNNWNSKLFLYLLLMERQVQDEIDSKQASLFYFCPESAEIRPELQNLKNQASCQFYRGDPLPHQLSLTGQQSTIYKLSIKEGWVIETDSRTDLSLSKFRCDCFKTFEVIRHPSQISRGTIQADGLIFTFFAPEKRSLALLAPQKEIQNLYNFCRVLQSQYILQSGFHSIFKPVRRLSRGLTCNVYSAQNLVDQKYYALKGYHKNGQQNHISRDVASILMQVVLLKEFRIWQTLNHKNILKLKAVFETQSTIYMVTQQLYMTLHAFTNKYGFVRRDKVRQLLRDIIEGIQHLHERGIMHRDIKLDNIMLRRDDLSEGKLVPIIMDFGLAQYINQRPYHFLKCGTPGFTAPEILAIESRQTAGLYDEKCDMFSFGAIAYILLCKRMPFPGASKQQILAKNKACQIHYDKNIAQSIGPDGIDFLIRLLDKDPARRMGAIQAIYHPFLQQSQTRWVQKKLSQGSTALLLPQK